MHLITKYKREIRSREGVRRRQVCKRMFGKLARVDPPITTGSPWTPNKKMRKRMEEEAGKEKKYKRDEDSTWRFSIPCFVRRVCFVSLASSVSAMPLH